MATIRQNIQDFMSAIRSQGKIANGTSPNVYGATLNADGSVSVTRNNVVIWPKIVYNQGCQSVGTQGDANQDSMTIYAADGSIATGSVTNFLSTLT